MITNPYSGKFVTFEGIDGSGKSEQFSRTVRFMQAYHPKIPMADTKEPTKNLSGVEIYNILHGRHSIYRLAEMHRFHFQSFYFKDRIWHYKSVVIPALNIGTHILSDRGVASGAFGAKSPDDFKTIIGIQEQMFLAAEVPFIWPDLILIFDVDVSVAMERLNKRGVALDQFEQEGNLKRVRENYLAFAKTYPNCRIVDGSAHQTLWQSRNPAPVACA